LEEGKSLDRKYKPFDIEKTTKKMDFEEECSSTHCQGVLALPEPPWGSA
jgi:hypothetical protein